MGLSRHLWQGYGCDMLALMYLIELKGFPAQRVDKSLPLNGLVPDMDGAIHDL